MESLAYKIHDNEIFEYLEGEQLLRRINESYMEMLPKEGSYVKIFEVPDLIRVRGYTLPFWSLDPWGESIIYKVVGYKEGIKCFRSNTNSLILEYKDTFREISLIYIFNGFYKIVEVKNGTSNKDNISNQEISKDYSVKW